MTSVPAFALVYALIAWINGTGLIEPAVPPVPLELNVTNPAGIVHDMQRCMTLKGEPPLPDDVARQIAEGVYGIYCEDRISINGLEVDLTTPEGQTVLVHELVHWLQDYNGEADNAPCVPHLERNAYAVHHEWQAQMGLPQAPDPFTVHMRSQCPAEPVEEAL